MLRCTAWRFMGKRCAMSFLLATLFVANLAAGAPPSFSLNAKPAPLADNVAVGDRVDNIRFLGMLAIPNTNIGGLRIGQLSDIAWDDNGSVLYAVTDKGALLHLQPVFRGDVLSDVRLLRAVPLRELKTNEPLKYKRRDAEGLTLVKGADGQLELLVSFERFPRIMRYRPDGYALGEYALPPALANVKTYRDENRMLEAICYDPVHGVLTTPEEPPKGEAPGFNRLYSLSGRSWRYPMAEGNGIVSLSCLGNGEVLIVERYFGRFAWNFRTTLKRVRLPNAPTEAPLAAESLLTLDTSKGFQIDNFEGISRHRGRRFFLVSDDNDFFLERTLLLYFELLDKP